MMVYHIFCLHFYLIISFIAHFWINLADAKISVITRNGELVDSFRDKESLFGAALLMDIKGIIVSADPPDACTDILEPTFLTNFTLSKFVLINGTGKCMDITKVRNAERAGYDAAVLYSYGMSSTRGAKFGLEVNIPSVHVSIEDGLIIEKHYTYDNRSTDNYILILIPNPQDIRFYILLFGAVIAVCFFVMFIFMICLLVKCIQERHRNRRNRLSTRQIKQIPTMKFSKGDHYDACAICLEEYNEGDKLRILPCSHAYHARCVDPWLTNIKRNCPLCKRKITFGDSGSDSDTDSELTSPAENTPLISSPSTRSQTWGTFAGTVNPTDTTDTEEGLVRPHSSEYGQSPSCSFEREGDMNLLLASDDENSDKLPSSNCSVNCDEQATLLQTSDSDSGDQVVYNFPQRQTPIEPNGTAVVSALQHGFIV